MRKLLKIFASFLLFLVVTGAIFWFYLSAKYEVPILMYHSFDSARINTYAAVSPRAFERQMRFIKKNGYRVILLDEYCQLLKSHKPVPRNLVVITLDDGYKDTLEAINILKQFDFPATIFIIVDRIGTEGHLSREDIIWFLTNTKISIGSHTITHPDFMNISEMQLKKEIEDSKNALEAVFLQPIRTISYPTGIFNEDVLKEAEMAGYLCGCTTNRGFSKALNMFALRRIKITDSDNDISLWMKLRGFYNFFRKLKEPY